MAVDLPQVPSHMHRGVPLPAQITDNMASAHTILVVDDNRDAADSLAQLFGFMGANASVAYEGSSALEAMLAHPPTLAFIDIGMPVMDGYELAAHIRATDAIAGVVLVALTGWGQTTDRERIMEAGFDHHLIKPADIRQLAQLLKSCEHALIDNPAASDAPR